MSYTGSSQDSGLGSYRETLRQVAKESEAKQTETQGGLKLGQVLYVFKVEEDGGFLHDYSSRMRGEEGSEVDLLPKIIVRIPSIHASLAEPTVDDILKSKDQAADFDYRKTAIVNYPVFVAQNIDVPIPAVGSYVWVQYSYAESTKFGVYVSVSTGQYVGREASEGEGETNSDSEDSSTTGKKAFKVDKSFAASDVIPFFITTGRLSGEFTDYGAVRKTKSITGNLVHKGIDLSNGDGKSYNVYTPVSGIVVRSEESPSYWPYTITIETTLSDGSKMYHRFSHLAQNGRVLKGDTVESGQKIGQTSSTEANGRHARDPARRARLASANLGSQNPEMPAHVHYDITTTEFSVPSEWPNAYRDPLYFLQTGLYSKNKMGTRKYPIKIVES
jgi:murein DD-endopeptidase MepM/ murein hydrolase activator NlpD